MRTDTGAEPESEGGSATESEAASSAGEPQTVDFLVIGSGSGLDVASAAASRGQSVAVVEKGPLGGTCLNRGCIPSKKLLYHAEVLTTIERADEFGIHADVTDVEFAEIVRDVTDDVSGSADSIKRGLRSSSQHTLLEGEGRFVDDRTVELVSGPDNGKRVRGETVLIAAGTRPSIPAIEGIDDVDYLTSTEALQLETPPDDLVIVGGGYIAAELAHFFGTFGSDVSIIGRRPRLLPQADEEVGDAVTEQYADRFDVYTGYEAVGVSQSGEGQSGDGVTVDARPYPPAWDDPDDRDALTVSGETLLVAAGRRPNTDTLNLDATGVETDAQGFVATDEYLRTTTDGIWALGDIVGEYLLKHNANHEAQAVARNLFGDELEPVDYTAMPFAVFGSPEVAGVGLREQDLREAARPYATTTYQYEETARGQAMHAEGFVKVLIEPNGEILGCHIIGPDAPTLIEEVVVAMKAGTGTVWDIRESVHVHPALSEVVDRAFSGQFTRRGSDGGGQQHGHGHRHEHGQSDDHEHDQQQDHQTQQHQHDHNHGDDHQHDDHRNHEGEHTHDHDHGHDHDHERDHEHNHDRNHDETETDTHSGRNPSQN
ncbi:dihydrolipoamide dehydrogenase [Natrialba hulunbeirensis JCM 10989]|uniref:Dihydrolipoamide dehydrogenase n=1 Tax=Natrialba hulunbeirensis JCM 10989 TaxID=1227493 RepID=M0A4W5_9EURY|nr:dihydrolipoyl dehydrogenase [Natrialba hulunbeirensis]ELY92388.1 dihydrolipoamide dehydrogenase [Natrialba hulunbeirensis JCM 10989]